MASVIYEGVTKRFGDVQAVNDLSLEIKDKEFLVLVGPSGCGKSTALRCLAGLEEITNGRIFIADRVVNDVPPKDRNIAMVFQSYALYPHMSVYDNMAFGLKLRRIPKNEINRRVQEAAKILGIETLLDRKPKQLSGGQRQRVALGRAIVREPAVFLLDEPLSNLDAKLRVQTRSELIKLHQRLGTTFIYVTHDQMEAMTMADRIAVLRDGILQQIDTPQNLYDYPGNIFVAGFIGSPAMNFFNATLTGSGDDMYVDAGSFRLKVTPSIKARMKDGAGKKIVFGIRPEDIYFPGFMSPGIAAVEVESMVDVTELMGNEIFLYLMTGDQPYIARVDPRAHVRVGEKVKMAFNADKVHMFDAEAEGQPALLKVS
jgi:multiple sugar transport system ATP-binding protein